jgi:hypothetical protein
VAGPADLPAITADLWLVSIFRHLIPAAGWLGEAKPPASLLELAEHGRWYCLAAARGPRRWRVLGSWSWERP